MSRLNAFFQLIDDGEVSPWKHKHTEEKDVKKKINNSVQKLDAKEKQRLSIIQQKFSGFLKINEVREADSNGDDSSSVNSVCDYPDDDEYNAFNLEDEENTYFNKVGIQAMTRALSKKKKSNFEVKILTHALMHNPFFKKMRRQITETLYQDLFKEIQLESFNALETIFEFGDMGDKFYIILQGEVFILSPSQLGIALQKIEREKEQMALQKLKTEPNVETTAKNLNLNLNLNAISEKGREGSSRNSPKSSSRNKEGSFDQSPNSYNCSPVLLQKKDKNSLLKYAINNHHTNNRLNDSFSSALSLDQTSSYNFNDQTSGNGSPMKIRLGDKFFESRMSNSSENLSRSSSPRSNRSSVTIRNTENSAGSDLEKFKRKKISIEQQVFDKYPNFQIIKKLGVGDNFGEIALRMDKERTATVICKTNCKFAVISKTAFQHILGDFFKSQMEEKEQFLSKLELFKGYNFSFLANMLMNVKKRIYNFDDIIYEEGSQKQKFFFIQSGEVELSKKVVLQNTNEIKYEGNNEFKKIDRVVMAQKYANDWFGEVEIMQKIPRFTRARCVSAKLEVYHISALKFFANLNIEEMVTDLKKNSAMIDKWRQKHYETMINQIQNSKRDPLRKTFENLQVAHDLINQKFKTEFLKTKPQTIVLPNKIEETSLAAKIVYFNTVKNYVGKISDVIGTISKMKKNKELKQKEDEIKDAQELLKKRQYQSRSQSLPRFIQCPTQAYSNNNSQNTSIMHYKRDSNVPSEQSSPIKLPKLQLHYILDDLNRQQKGSSSKALSSNKSNLGGVQSHLSLSLVNSPQLMQSQQEINQITEREKTFPNQFSTPQSQKIPLKLKKKNFSQFECKQEIEDQSGRNSSNLIPQISSQSLNYIQTHHLKSIDRIPTDQEFLENLYDGIIHSKNKKHQMFNSDMNQKIIEDGLRKKNQQAHQPKPHIEDFSNLLNQISVKVGLTNDKVSLEKAEKLRLFRKLKLDNILNYKYANRMSKTQLDTNQITEQNNKTIDQNQKITERCQQINVQSKEKIITEQKTNEKLDRDQISKSVVKNKGQILQSQKYKFQMEVISTNRGQKLQSYQLPTLPKTFQNKLIPHRVKNDSIMSSLSVQSPLQKSLSHYRSLSHKKINPNITPSHFHIN